uniref:Uncharacterized protein n=1 Tax=Fagus sylvatica TaxID=28930 RepID=A0A2N9FG40_FAGSY
MVGGQSFHAWLCGGSIVMDERTLRWTSSYSVTNPARSCFLLVSGRLSIAIWRLGSSKDCLRPTGLGKMVKSLYAVIIGRGFHMRILMGTLSKSIVLDRPLLNSGWKERISRILDIEDRRYNIFIELNLLASFSFGLAPNCYEPTKNVRANTMKLNKGKLRKFAQSGEVVAAPVSLKHPSLPADPSEVWDATINQSSHVAMSRAKSVVSSRDMDDYYTAHTEDGHYLLIHSLMRGLNEAMVMSQRCIAVEEDLATLREALIELEKVKAELKAGDDDVKVAVEVKDKAIADLQHLVGQIEGAKAAAVSKFRAFEAFEDINTRYFLSGFEAFRKQAAERFPDLDFYVF